MSEKHTPGPWTLEAPWRVVANGINIASTWTRRVDEERLDGESWLDMRTRVQPTLEAVKAEAEANARLIASAPDLLEALEDLLNDCINFDGGKLTDAFLVKAARAIAKAKGG